jgi:hypothetical protein
VWGCSWRPTARLLGARSGVGMEVRRGEPLV